MRRSVSLGTVFVLFLLPLNMGNALYVDCNLTLVCRLS